MTGLFEKRRHILGLNIDAPFGTMLLNTFDRGQTIDIGEQNDK